MLTVLMATATATLFGVADFLGGVASRRSSAVAVTATAHGLGVVIFAACVLLFPAPRDAGSLMAGAAAGVCGGIGVAALYAALARGRMSVVAPLTAALSGSIPALYDFATGSRLQPTAIAGLVLAFIATIVVSATSTAEEGETAALPPAALGFAITAGFGFSGSFISFSFASPDSGFWPLIAARIVSFSLLALFATARRGPLNVAREVRPVALGAGVLDSAANVTMVSAIRMGPLAVASVLGSLYPVVTLLLARIVLGERLHGWQRVGVASALAAVLLAATPWPLTFG